MRRALFVGSLLACLLGGPRAAHAEDIATYEVEGDAETTGGDPRVAALDEAFADAVRAAVGDLVDADARAAKQADIDREIVGRARLWIAKFTVNKDATVGDRRQLSVSVRVDRDKLLARLSELEVATRMATVLLRVDGPSGTRATFGQGGERDIPGANALTATLRAAGMNAKRAPVTGDAARRDGTLPLADDEAVAMALDAKADVVLVAGVAVSAPVPVRGVATDAVSVTATVRAIDRRGPKVIGQGVAVAGAAVSSNASDAVVNKAIERALIAATGDALPRASQATAIGGASMFSGTDTPVGEAGTVLVRVAPKTPWGLVAAELKYLQGAKGVKRAVVRRVSPGGWVIGVVTAESLDKIASIVKKAPSPDITSRVKVTGDIIDVSLAGAP